MLRSDPEKLSLKPTDSSWARTFEFNIEREMSFRTHNQVIIIIITYYW